MVVQIFLARGILFQYLLTEDDIFSYVTDILKLIFNFFSRYSCAPVALFSAPVTKYVGENYLPIKV